MKGFVIVALLRSWLRDGIEKKESQEKKTFFAVSRTGFSNCFKVEICHILSKKKSHLDVNTYF